MNWFLPFSCLAIWGPLLQQPPARVFQIERWRTLLSIGVKNPNLCSNIHQYGANTTLKSDIDKASAPFHEACRTYLKLYSVKNVFILLGHAGWLRTLTSGGSVHDIKDAGCGLDASLRRNFVVLVNPHYTVADSVSCFVICLA